MKQSILKIAGAAALTCAFAMPVRAEVQKIVTWSVPPAGASGYLMVTGFSGVVTKNTPVEKIILQNFAGAAAWPTRMQRGELNFGQHCGFKQMSEAWKGEGAFKQVGPLHNIRNVATGYGLAYGFHFIDDDVKTIKDMKGKRLFLQVRHHDQVTAARVMLDAVGLEYGKDVKIIPVRSPRESIQGLMTGRGDGVGYGAIPGFAQVHQAKGMHTVPMPADILAKIQKAEPVWGITKIPAGRGPFKPKEDVPVLEIACGFAASVNTSADTVYAVLKAIYEHHDDWKGVHPLAKQWSVQKAVQVIVQPFHEGAIRFYKEKGVWTPEIEAKHNALLAEAK